MYFPKSLGHETAKHYIYKAIDVDKYSRKTPGMQKVEIVVAPALLTEGKVYQKAQQLGMGK